jgi:hypothetical protein
MGRLSALPRLDAVAVSHDGYQMFFREQRSLRHGVRALSRIVAIWVLALIAAGCGASVDVESDRSEPGRSNALCEQARAHYQECGRTDYVLRCEWYEQCSYGCALAAPCDVLNGAVNEAHWEYLDCEKRCRCPDERAYAEACGGDVSGIDCTRMLNVCPCGYIRECTKAEEWRQCLLANASTCFSDAP